MIAYLDSTAWVAWFNPDDNLGPVLECWWGENDGERLFNPILQAEVRHALRRIPDDNWRATAWAAYQASENAGRLIVSRFPWDRTFERADELSARHGLGRAAGIWDLLHVASALISGADVFVTGDRAQAEIAGLAGLNVVQLTATKR